MQRRPWRLIDFPIFPIPFSWVFRLYVLPYPYTHRRALRWCRPLAFLGRIGTGVAECPASSRKDASRVTRPRKAIFTAPRTPGFTSGLSVTNVGFSGASGYFGPPRNPEQNFWVLRELGALLAPHHGANGNMEAGKSSNILSRSELANKYLTYGRFLLYVVANLGLTQKICQKAGLSNAHSMSLHDSCPPPPGGGCSTKILQRAKKKTRTHLVSISLKAYVYTPK